MSEKKKKWQKKDYKRMVWYEGNREIVSATMFPDDTRQNSVTN